MIRQTIEKGTAVFHAVLGYGVVIEFNPADITGDEMCIRFEDGIHYIPRKRLTEIEDKP